MSKDRFRKHYEELDDAERKVAKEKKRLQNSCPHNDHGDLTLRWVSGGEKGEKKAYKCDKCSKLISPRAPESKEVFDAINVIETASDYMRMMVDASTEEGAEKLKWHGKMLDELTKMAKNYEKLKNYQANKKKEQGKKNARRGSAYIET